MTPSEIAAWAGLITSTIGAIFAGLIALRQVKIGQSVSAVHREVATSNGHTLGEIVEANNLTGVTDDNPEPKLQP